jgi:hypothetical protein
VPQPVLTNRRYDKAESEPYYVRGAGDAETGLDRIFSPPAARSWRANGWVTVAPTALDDEIDALAGYAGPSRLNSSSRFEGTPGYRASSAFDGDPNSAWVGSWNPNRLAWLSWTAPRPVALSTLRIAPARLAVRRPTVVRLRWASGSTPPLRVGANGAVTLPRPVRADSFRLEILKSTPAPALAVGIGELAGPGVPHARVARGGQVQAPCGAVSATVGTGKLSMRPAGSIAELDAGQPLRAVSCGGAVSLPAGQAELHAPAGVFAPYLLRLSSPVAHAAAPAPGRVLDTGNEGLGSHKHVKVALTRPAVLVLGESYNRGWRASCDGRSLGTPFVVDGYANGWNAPAGCRNVSFTFGPNRALDVSYVISAVAALLMLALLILRRPGRAEPIAPGELPGDDAPRGWPLKHALAAGVIVGLVAGFVFALRAGVAAGPAVALLLWRGVGARRLTLAAGALLVLAVPLVYLIWPATDRGGYNNEYATDHLGAHWVMVAAFVLLALALARTVAVSRATRPSRAPAPAAEGAPRAAP